MLFFGVCFFLYFIKVSAGKSYGNLVLIRGWLHGEFLARLTAITGLNLSPGCKIPITWAVWARVEFRESYIYIQPGPLSSTEPYEFWRPSVSLLRRAPLNVFHYPYIISTILYNLLCGGEWTRAEISVRAEISWVSRIIKISLLRFYEA
jgi:hypothetical protein